MKVEIISFRVRSHKNFTSLNTDSSSIFYMWNIYIPNFDDRHIPILTIGIFTEKAGY